jgi:hypothetical protein
MISEATYWTLKVLIAVPGAYVLWRGYRAYRRRQRDRTHLQDPKTDRWWRTLFLSGAAALSSLISILALDALQLLPRPLLYAFLIVMFGGVLLAGVATFMIGWRSA